ncbi:MAG: alpha/beta fold hydrolase [Nitrospirae bacterium]|nr:alpha/beta fold hydrolase [Nitrospirota bacterium]
MLHFLYNLLIFIFVLSFIFVFLTYFIFLYEWGNATPEERKEVEPLAIGLAFIKEVFYTYVQALGLPLGYLHWENLLSVSAPRNSVPFVFVHGYMQTPSVFLYMRYRMKKRGWGKTFVVHLRPRTAPVEILAEVIMRKVEEVKRITGQPRVVLVAHSLGGLAAMYYIEKLGGRGSVHRAVLIGTPFQGTKLSILGLGANARQMRYKNAFLSSLFEPNMQTGVPVLACQIIPDNLIIPNHSALPPFMAKTTVVRAMGHLGCLFSEELLDEILKFSDPQDGGSAASRQESGAAEAETSPAPSIGASAEPKGQESAA